MSLVIVHSKPNEGDDRGFAYMYITGDLWQPLVADDPWTRNPFFYYDSYDSLYDREDDMTLLKWYWTKADTDGMANPLPSPYWQGCIEIDATFDDEKYPSIEKWKFVSTRGTTLGLKMDETLFVCVGDFYGKRFSVKRAKREAVRSNPFPRDEGKGYCERPVCHWHLWCNMARVLNCQFNAGIPQP